MDENSIERKLIRSFFGSDVECSTFMLLFLLHQLEVSSIEFTTSKRSIMTFIRRMKSIK
jgi:hypothetical protein